MAFVHLWRGQTDQAIQASESALAIKEQLGGYPFLGAVAVTTMAVTHTMRGDYAAADHFFDLLFHLLDQMAVIDLTGSLYLRGRTYWLQGRLEETHQVYARMRADERVRESPLAPVLLAMMRGLLAMAAHRYAEAERSLRQAASLEREMRLATLYDSAHLLLAYLYLEQNQPQDALAELELVLAECEQKGTPGRILREGTAVVPLLRLAVERDLRAIFATHLLDLLGAREPRPVHVPDTGETLTPREVEVLRMIAAGATNHAIAEQLVISIHTVKSHVVHILRKLNVASRTQAASRARDLRII